jgi:hypothetical protein
MNNTNQKPGREYLNPYFAGLMLGMLLIATFYITGRGLGASGAMKSAVVSAVNTVTPEHAKASKYYSKFISDDVHPLNTWLSYEVLGIFAGALLSGVLWRRVKLKVEHSPKITSRTRLLMALIGGMTFGFGSQLARGCTSGMALTGMASLATAGFVAMMTIFGTAYAFAYLYRKFWI